VTYEHAVRLLESQDRNIRKINGKRFEKDGWEYRLVYEGGFAACIRIDRRLVGKRKFEYFDLVSAADCLTAEEAERLVEEEIQRKVQKKIS